MKGTNALIILTTLTLCGACAAPPPATAPLVAAPPSSAATSRPSAATPPSSAATSAAATSAPRFDAGWSTAPVAVKHEPAVPPVPVLERVRYAAHKDGFDRVVLDIPGALPGYTAKYVTEVRRDGSDQPVAMPGEAYLLIVLHPARAHRENGTATVTGIHRTGLAGVKAYAIVGDFEGYVSIALGLSGVRKYHVGELPGRVYIDVAV